MRAISMCKLSSIKTCDLILIFVSFVHRYVGMSS